MIYRNGKLWQMPKDGVQSTLKELGLEYPITLKYVSDRITYDADNETPVQPAGLHIPCKANVITDSGIDQYRYATSVRKNQKNQDVFSPSTFDVNKSSLLTRKDGELIYFLYHFSPMLKGGKNEGLRPFVQFEMAEKEAAEANKTRSIRAKVESLIYQQEDVEVLRGIAYAYHMDNVEKAGIETLKQRIIQFVTVQDSAESYERLLNIVEAPENYDDHRLISMAFAKKIIVADKVKKAYFWINEDGSTGGAVVNSRGNRLGEKEFFNQVKNDKSKLKEILDQIKIELESRG
jgi:hypothetical protein